MTSPSRKVSADGSFAGSAEATTTLCCTPGSWLLNAIVNGVSAGAVSVFRSYPVTAAPLGAASATATVSTPLSPVAVPTRSAAPDSSMATPKTPPTTVRSELLVTRLREAAIATIATIDEATSSAVTVATFGSTRSSTREKPHRTSPMIASRPSGITTGSSRL